MKTILVLAATALLFVPLSAQQDSNREEVRKQAQEARAKMHEWFSQEVVPTLREWHNEYDASLSKEDLATLEKLRAEAKQIKEKIHAEMKSLKEMKKDVENKKELREKMHAIKKTHHKEMKQIIEQVKPIAKASKEQLLALRDENSDQIKAWKEEAREMMKESRERMRDAAKELDRSEMKRMKRMMKHRKGPHELGMLFEGGRKAALRFMLWDGTIPELEERMDGITTSPQRRVNLGAVKVSPNPGASTATVHMDKVPGNIATIEVYDMNGSLVESTSADISSGTIHERIDTSKLAPGTYMVSVNTNGGRKTTTLVINN